MATSAARGVTQVMNRCEEAKTSGYLDLSNCELMYIADALYMVLKDYCQLIDKCSLKNNKLKKFPKKLITKFPNMVVLNLEGNLIEEVPEEIQEWTKLKGLNLAGNCLTEFPLPLLEVKQLTLLDLSKNQIEDLDLTAVASSLPSLKQLNVGGNKLAEEQRAKIAKLAKTHNLAAKFD